MALVELPSTSPTGARPPPAVDGPTIVDVRGEHDISTVAALAAELARAIGAADADLTIDLSEVRFMDASTVSVILLARQFLRGRQHSLAVRAPSRCAQRIIHICELDELLEARPLPPAPAPPTLLLAG